MLPISAIAEWGINQPWATTEQIEQDLLLSRAICAIADDPLLRDELLFRGGTALHKLHLPSPLRYSEDLDYVRTTAGGIGLLMRALTSLGDRLGFDVRTRISEHPKVLWGTTSQTGSPLRIKIEINTHERPSTLAPMSLPLNVESGWWNGSAEIPTFQLVSPYDPKLAANLVIEELLQEL